MTLKELSQLFHLNREIDLYKNELKKLEEPAISMTQTISGMPHISGIIDKVGKNATDIAYYRERIEQMKQQCWVELRRLNKYIMSIDDSLTRQIFTFRFINGLEWDDVANCVGGGNTEGSVKQICYRYLRKH